MSLPRPHVRASWEMPQVAARRSAGLVGPLAVADHPWRTSGPTSTMPRLDPLEVSQRDAASCSRACNVALVTREEIRDVQALEGFENGPPRARERKVSGGERGEVRI